LMMVSGRFVEWSDALFSMADESTTRLLCSGLAWKEDDERMMATTDSVLASPMTDKKGGGDGLSILVSPRYKRGVIRTGTYG
jgi:hypothetical protein